MACNRESRRALLCGKQCLEWYLCGLTFPRYRRCQFAPPRSLSVTRQCLSGCASGFRDQLEVLQSPPSSVRFYGGGLQHESGRLFGARIRHVPGTQGDISSGVGRDSMTSARSGMRDKSRIRSRIRISWRCHRSEMLDHVWG